MRFHEIRIPRFGAKFVAAALLALVPFGLWGCFQEGVADSGSGDETSTLAFYRTDGNPAAGARVLVYASSDTTVVPQTLVFTNSEGEADIPSLPHGFYNIVVKDESGNAAFQDSLVSNGSSLPYRSDTLVASGSVKGRVKVQSQHDPKIVWLALLGAGVYMNVDDSGYFLIPNMPEGRFSLALSTDVAGYTKTFQRVDVHRDSVTDLGEIRMIYTGLPVATGIVGEWDSLLGMVSLKWDSISTNRLSGWKILRGIVDDPNAASQVGYVSAGMRQWNDTLFRSSDRLPVRATYWIQAVGKDGKPGDVWSSWSVDARPPLLVSALSPAWSNTLCLEACGLDFDANNPWASSQGILDTMDGALGKLDFEAVVSSNATVTIVRLKKSTDGVQWETIREWPETLSVVDPSTSFSIEPRNSLEGLRHGIFHHGRFWWLETKRSNRFMPSLGMIGSDSVLADSFVVHSVGGDGKEALNKVPAASEYVKYGRIVAQGDSIGMVQWFESTTSGGTFRTLEGRFLLSQANDKWTASPEGVSWKNVVEHDYSETDFDGPERIDLPAGTLFLRKLAIATDTGTLVKYAISSSVDGIGDTLPFQYAVDLASVKIRYWQGKLVSLAMDGLYWADPSHASVWHRVETPAADWKNQPTVWNGKIWMIVGGGLRSASP